MLDNVENALSCLTLKLNVMFLRIVFQIINILRGILTRLIRDAYAHYLVSNISETDSNHGLACNLGRKRLNDVTLFRLTKSIFEMQNLKQELHTFTISINQLVIFEII